MPNTLTPPPPLHPVARYLMLLALALALLALLLGPAQALAAYEYSVSDPVVRQVDGRRHVTWTVTETDVSPGDEWTIPGVPNFVTMTLFECELTVAGSASTVDPEVGLDDAWAVDTLDEVVVNDTAAVHVRNQTAVPIYVENGKLVGRSQPNVATGATGTVVTRVTVVLGHD